LVVSKIFSQSVLVEIYGERAPIFKGVSKEGEECCNAYNFRDYLSPVVFMSMIELAVVQQFQCSFKLESAL
jgi:hypothetical protein